MWGMKFPGPAILPSRGPANMLINWDISVLLLNAICPGEYTPG
jgi:hypothetical protein